MRPDIKFASPLREAQKNSAHAPFTLVQPKNNFSALPANKKRISTMYVRYLKPLTNRSSKRSTHSAAISRLPMSSNPPPFKHFHTATPKSPAIHTVPFCSALFRQNFLSLRSLSPPCPLCRVFMPTSSLPPPGSAQPSPTPEIRCE
jgi:hypothetical protein